MGIGETAALVGILVLVFQGLMKLIEYLMKRSEQVNEDEKLVRVLKEVSVIKDKVTRLDYKFDTWGTTQEKIVERLENISQAELKILGIIERLERRVESLPG